MGPTLMQGYVAAPPAVGGVTEAMAWAAALVLLWMLMDWLTGLGKAAKAGALSSSVGREGLWHKAGELGVVVLAFMVELGSAHLDLGFTAPVVVPVCAYIIVTETMSILENLCEMNPELRGSRVMRLFESTKSEERAGGGAGKGESDGDGE